MVEPRIIEGEFFLESSPEIRHHGVLTIDDQGKSQLKLFGSFNRPSPAVDHTSYTIWGQAFDGQAISLLDCSRKQKKTTFGVAETEVWGANFVFIGGLVKDRQTPFFISVSAEIESLREWINIDGGELKFSHTGNEFDYHYKDPESILIPIDDNFKGYIYFKNTFWVGLDYKHQAEQFTRIHFESAANVSFHDFLMLLRNFRNLVSLFIGQKVRLNSIVFTSNEAFAKVISPTRPEEPILKDIEFIFNDSEQYGKLPERLVYFVRFEDIAPDFGTIVQNWMLLIDSPLAPVSGLLLDAITDHSYFEENDFLRAWQGVEAFHRIILQDSEELKKKFNAWYGQIRAMISDQKLLKKLDGKLTYGYEMPAPNRLMELLKANSTVLHLTANSAQMDFWIKEMSNTRNYLTHFEPAMAIKKAPLQNIVYYRNLLKALLVVLILRHLGVREQLLGIVTKNSVFYYHPINKIGPA